MSQYLSEVTQRLQLLRVGKAATTILGRQYRPNPLAIEIDITYRCQLQCFNCNRSCRQAPATDDMTREQIAKFIQESIRHGRRWETIGILGGEPTQHPEFPALLEMLCRYRADHAPDVDLVVKSNGFGDKTQRILSQIPPEVRVVNSGKVRRFQGDFGSFNLAPRDLHHYRDAEFANGCTLCAEYGIGLTRSGYYPCAVAGGIDRVFGFDAGRKSLPAPDDRMLDLLRLFCPYCGHFKRFNQQVAPEREEISPVWSEGYRNYQLRPPELTRY